MRILFVLFISLFFLQCETSKKAKTNEMHISLQQQLGYGGFDSARKVLFPLPQATADSLKRKQKVADFFEEYVIRKYVLSDALAMYRKWQAGEIDDKRWKILKRVYDIEPEKLIEINPQNEVLIAYGSNQDGKRALQVDTDLDGSFKNDSLVPIDYPLEFIDQEDKEYYLNHQLQYLPQFELNINYPTKEGKLPHDFTLLIDPYNVDDLVNYVEGDELERSYFLAVSIPAYYSDTLTRENTRYEVKLAGNFKEPLLEEDNTNIKITKIDSSAAQSKIQAYHINDSLILGEKAWQISEVKKNGSAIKFRQLPDSTKIYRLAEGYYLPPFSKQPISGKGEQEKAKPITYWVWNTTVMNKDFVDQMQQWQQNNPQQDLMTIAYDANRGAVKRLIDRYQLRLTTYYVDPKNAPLDFSFPDEFPFAIQLDQQRKILRLKRVDTSRPQR